MLKFSKLLGLLAATLFALMWVAPAQAQATRTWVSGVGDDANPCSRTAPCKTFAGAISKTAAGGEIDVLDPGGFGGVTITKAMTIDGSGGSIAGVLVAGTPGMTVNALAADTVTIRNIDFEGLGATISSPGTYGIRFIAGGVLNVQHCVIRNFRDPTNGTGIFFAPGGASKLYVEDTILTGNGTAAANGGIVIQPSGAGSAIVSLNHVYALANNNVGLLVNTTGVTAVAGIVLTVTNSEFSGAKYGIDVITPASTTTAVVNVFHTVVNNNTSGGVIANGATATVRLGESTISGNGTGIAAINSGTLTSFGDNQVVGPGTPGTSTAPNATPL